MTNEKVALTTKRSAGPISPRSSAGELVAAARVHAALDAMEKAQWLLDDAAQALSPVQGYAKSWQRTVQTYETVKNLWRAVDAWRTQLGPTTVHVEPDAAEVARWLRREEEQ